VTHFQGVNSAIFLSGPILLLRAVIAQGHQVINFVLQKFASLGIHRLRMLPSRLAACELRLTGDGSFLAFKRLPSVFATM
jgi:hypothetical protein